MHINLVVFDMGGGAECAHNVNSGF
jgi:hypothetical protein